MKHRVITTAGFAIALGVLWTMPGAAQQQDPGQVRQVRNEQQTQAGQAADAGNRTLTRTQAGARGMNAQGSDMRPSKEPKMRQLGARDGSGNQGQSPMDGSGAGPQGKLGQRGGTGSTGAACTGDGPRGTANTSGGMRSLAQERGRASSCTRRGGASRSGSRAGRGGRR